MLVDLSGQEIVPSKKVPEVVDVNPFGSMILVELLTAEEMLGTSLYVKEDVDVGPQQAYVVKIGPKLPEDCGVKVGDRVMLTGNFVPVVRYDTSHRQRGLIDFHVIKGVLVEKTPSAE